MKRDVRMEAAIYQGKGEMERGAEGSGQAVCREVSGLLGQPH